MNCPNCNSSRVIPYTKLIDHGDASEIDIAVRENPDAWVMKGWKLAQVAGTVCCDCARVTLTALGDLDQLWSAYQKSGEHTEKQI